MMVNGYRKWGPFAGVLAVGMLAFGLSLQGAPAGDAAAGTAEHLKRVRGDAGAVSKVRADLTPETALDKGAVMPMPSEPALRKARKGALKMRRPSAPVSMRVKAATGYSPGISTSEGRAAVAVGDPCSCDADCAGLTTEGGCKLGQCIRAAEAAGEPNIDGTCQVVTQIAETRCETDGDPCTVGRCQANGTCTDGASQASPCAKQCTGGGVDDGQNCTLQTQCADPNVCDNKPRVTCVNDAGRANCQVDGGDDQFGRCCDASGNGTYTTQAACPAGSEWLELTDPDDELHLPVRCPAASFGIVFGGGADDANAISPIVPPPRQCSLHSPDDNFGAVCEVDSDCLKRCAGDNLTICFVAQDCIDAGTTGPCNPDQCISALDADVTEPPDGGRCPGDYMVGDDYL
ncbi:MAG: hypothetical protein ACE5HE_14165, partial [Phycisphaerae bacterium]